VLDVNGSPEYAMTWKRQAMPSGAPICRLAARARRTSEAACSGWPSPKAVEDGRTLEQYEAGRQRGYENRKGKTNGGPASKQGGLAIAAQLVGWPTPGAVDATTNHEKKDQKQARGSGGINLTSAAELAGWPTPMAGSPATEDYNEAGNTDSGRKTVELCGWATPAARDWKSGDASETTLNRNARPLNEQAVNLSGPPPTSSPAATEKRGVLNPEHSRWLMGYPAAWGCSGATAMQSCRKSRRHSSAPS
jgi:hypothetical protein